RDQRWPADGKRKATAFLHAGCVMHVAFAHIDEATVRVLQKAGCDVLAPSGQGCCGAITIHAGDMDGGRRLAKRNIEAFERSNADVYVVNAAGCGSALKEYGNLFEGDPEWKDRAAAFSANVRDVTEWLEEIGISGDLGRIDRTITYQEPCHLVHAQRIALAPRRLLARIPGLRLREMPESSVCCGSAGIYNLTQPEMAAKLGARKVKNILAVEPDTVVTANPGCAMQIASGLRDANAAVEVKHVVEMLDEAYAAYSPSMRAEPASASSSVR
ncbi:MAG: (Fe-S)-binding protein, partial [Polyangiaceae bacterium]